MKPEHLKLLRDKRWRLNNLYFITDKQGKKVRFRMTDEQIEYFDGMHTWNIILKARQLDAVVDADLRDHLERHAVFLSVDFVALLGKFTAGLGIATELTVVYVVRPPVLGIGVTLILEHLHVMPQTLARVLVVIDDVIFGADLAHEPDGRGVADANVPEGHHRQMAVVRDRADSLLCIQLGELLGVLGAFDRLLEGFDRN